MSLADISLRQRDRGLVLGGVDAGKSTLMDMLTADFLQRYPNARCITLDTKPRYRAQYTVQGRLAERRYRSWDHGAAVPGSVVVDDPRDLDLAWKLGYRHVIVQTGDDEGQNEAVARMLAIAAAFQKSARRGRPQLLRVDELGDFYHSNGAPRGGSDAIARSPRAGRERGQASLFGNQRTKGVDSVILSEMNRGYVLRLDARDDAKRLIEMGMPLRPDQVPTKEHVFWYWYKASYTKLYGPYSLNLPT